MPDVTGTAHSVAELEEVALATKVLRKAGRGRLGRLSLARPDIPVKNRKRVSVSNDARESHAFTVEPSAPRFDAIDVYKKYLTAEEREPTDKLRARVAGILELVRDAGLVLDVNARGYRACGEQYPATWILEEARRIGTLVTFGDDSHSPDEVGIDLDRATHVLRRTGYGSIALVRPGGELGTAPL